MRVNFLDVDKAVLLGVLGVTSVYLNSRYLEFRVSSICSFY